MDDREKIETVLGETWNSRSELRTIINTIPAIAWSSRPDCSVRAMEIAKRFCSFTPESLGYIKRLVRNATDTPLAQGLALERNLFMRLCVSDQGLARMRSYEEKKITEPSRSIEA